MPAALEGDAPLRARWGHQDGPSDARLVCRNTFNQQVGMWRAELGAPGDGVLHRECENQARGDPKCRKGEAVEPVRSTMFASQVGM